MPNTQVGAANMALASGQIVAFDQIASMIAAGSAVGRAMVAGASAAFPRAASIGFGYPFDSLVFRFNGAGSAMWTSDPVGTPNASNGMPIFNGDLKPTLYPGLVANFAISALAAGSLSLIFLQGDAHGL